MDRTCRRLLSIGLLLGAASALAQSSPAPQACWARDVERMDFLQNPPEGGDNAFFTGVSDTSGNTNVTLVWPAHAALMDFTQRLYRIRVDMGGTAPTGCSNAYLNGLPYFMPTGRESSRRPERAPGDVRPDQDLPRPGSDVRRRQRPERRAQHAARPTGTATGPPVDPPAGTAETYVTACLNAGGAAQQAACLACLNTRGYWLNPTVADNDVTPAAAVFTTNWLRFHPVKWVLLSLAYKRLVNGPLLLPAARGGAGQSSDVGATLVQKMLPQSCSGQGRPLEPEDRRDRRGQPTPARAYPLAEMLFNAAWYMGGQTSPWLFSSSTTIPTGYGNTKSGPCVNCRGDFIVLFGDGRGDTANAACTPVNGVTPAWCTAPRSARPWEWARRTTATTSSNPATGRWRGERHLRRGASGRPPPAPATWTSPTTSPAG